MIEIERKRTPVAYRVSDGLTEALIYFMVLFTPWAFGTTPKWTVWVMNVAGYALGGLLATKWLIRWRANYRPRRWGDEPIRDDTAARDVQPKLSRFVVISLATLTGLILAYCLISALNARATYDYAQMSFDYRDHFIPWLPHSYNSFRTWFVFWEYLGLALTFWAIRDWLLGKTSRERRASKVEELIEQAEVGTMPSVPLATSPSSAIPSSPSVSFSAKIPARLKRLLWVVCVNGALLALEGMLQRLDGTNKLLWLVEPYWNTTADAQFGPYAYRSNAAQYLNLVWPLCLGFWWTLRWQARSSRRKSGRAGGSPHLLLLPCAILMAASPIVSTSRGGAIVSVAQMAGALAIITVANRKEKRWLHLLGVLMLFAASLGLGAALGWKALELRLRNLFADEMSGRKEIYQNVRPMAKDYPMLGSGPGTFMTLYQLYRTKPDQLWQAYLHDDWLETKITFGSIGLGLILGALILATTRWFFQGGITTNWVLMTLLWLALAGCLSHARFDFPLQVYSVLFLFLLLCSISFCVSRQQ